ncbi:sensor histidine kinase [Roseateles sp.]|uniref:sensor histidine kinase n=1 Tax=Roseateles sp. TaxID=1971397 RepID=UPI00395040CA
MAPSTAAHVALASLLLVVRHVLAWTLVCIIGAAGAYADQTALSGPQAYADILLPCLIQHLPLIALSITVSASLLRHPRWLGEPRVLLAGYTLVLVLFLPATLMFLAWLDLPAAGSDATLAAAWHRALATPRFELFLQWAWASGTCVAVVAFHAWRQSRQRERALHRSQLEVLQLQLALEHQRLESLRGQLEPHFLFNALNAVGALIRDAEPAQALAGIQQLSELLRYALTAGSRDWVSLHEELQFVERYVALQRLRYGDRLNLRVEGADDASRLCELPVLLLQPLVENALRHDLDRHHGASEIALRCARDGDRLTIEVSNPAVHDAAPNPGTGLGLRNTEGRLRLLYGDAASLQVESGGASFLVRLELPSHAPSLT